MTSPDAPRSSPPLRVGVAIPAAGHGRRMGGAKKPYLTLAGEPILLHAPGLTPADLETIAAERGPSYAEIIAKRGRPRRSPRRSGMLAG